MSKSYGLPGLRMGWIACQDRDVLSRMERIKLYLSICNSGPSEHLARGRILARNNVIVDESLPKWNVFFARHPDLFDWRRPDGSYMGYPRYKGPEGVEDFARRLVEEAEVLVLPSRVYRSDLGITQTDRFRIGFGRKGLDAGRAALEEFLGRA